MACNANLDEVLRRLQRTKACNSHFGETRLKLYRISFCICTSAYRVWLNSRINLLRFQCVRPPKCIEGNCILSLHNHQVFTTFICRNGSRQDVTISLVVKMRFILSSGVIDTIGLSRVGRDRQFLASNLWRGVNERTNVGTFLTPMQIFSPPNVRLCYAYEVGTVPFCDSWTLRNTAILNIVNFISVWQISHYNTPFYRHFRFFANQYAWLSWQEGPFFQMSYNIIRVGQWKCASR